MLRARIEPKKARNGGLALGRLISFGFRKKRQQAISSEGSTSPTPPSHISTPGRPCFYLAILFECPTSTLHYEFSRLRKLCTTRQWACVSCVQLLLSAASDNDCRTVVRLFQTERSASDPDDNRTALHALPTARF
jgi:hypothetical protein